MQIQTIVFALTAVAAAAVTPARIETRTANLAKRADLCGPADTPLCCQTDVLGVADLSCDTIGTDVTTTTEFAATCKTAGKTAECCVLDALNSVALLCTQV